MINSVISNKTKINLLHNSYFSVCLGLSRRFHAFQLQNYLYVCHLWKTNLVIQCLKCTCIINLKKPCTLSLKIESLAHATYYI